MKEESIITLISHLLASDFVRLGRTCGALSVNTQARRFGPLLYLLQRVAEGKRTEALLTSLPRKDLVALTANMRQYVGTSGELKEKPSSVRHYLDLAREIGFLARQGGFFSLTTFGKLLTTMCGSNILQPYPLGDAVCIFVLVLLLRVDFIGLRSLAAILDQGTCSLVEARKKYYKSLIDSLSHLSEAARSEKVRRAARDRIIALKSWRKPDKYCEHLVSARVYWFSELNLIDLIQCRGQVIISPNESGARWFRSFTVFPVPNSESVARLALLYGEAVVTAADGVSCLSEERSSNGLCGCLLGLFEAVTDDFGVQKVRSDVVAMYLLSGGLGILKTAPDARAVSLAKTNELHCGTWKYTLHTGSRSTQSYLVKQSVSGES
ncbi:MAG TPA: hypothetical protein VM425_06035 [Myxococcota bacterium]|nr:hypothetical protein [Myxococcota bacterium]